MEKNEFQGMIASLLFQEICNEGLSSTLSQSAFTDLEELSLSHDHTDTPAAWNKAMAKAALWLLEWVEQGEEAR